MNSEINMETSAIRFKKHPRWTLPDLSCPVNRLQIDLWVSGLTVEMALTMPLVIWSCLMCFTTSNWAALCLGMIWSAIFFSSELNFLNRSSNSRDRSLRNTETKCDSLKWDPTKKKAVLSSKHNTTTYIHNPVINNRNYHINRKEKEKKRQPTDDFISSLLNRKWRLFQITCFY